MNDKLYSVIADIEIMRGVNFGKDVNRTLNDALALLYERVPRVLSLEELIQAKRCWVWMERRGGGFAGKPYAVEPQFHVGQDDRGNQFFMDRASRPNECYGFEWRCWNVEPSEDERKIAAWKRRMDDEQEA